MRVSRTSAFGLGIVALCAVVLALTRDWTTSGWGGVAGAASGLFVGVAAVAAISYRGRRDPSLLILAAGAGAFVALGVLVPALVRVLGGTYDRGDAVRYSRLAWYGPVAGAAILGVCLAFVVPWRDRRGRPPLRPGNVLAAVGLCGVGLTIALMATHPNPPLLPEPLRSGGTTTVPMLCAGAALIAGAVAAARLLERGGWHGWVGAGAAALTLAAVGWIGVEASEGAWQEIAYAWLQVLPTVAAALLLAGVLSTQRADTSRMRRATDRAAEVMEGRAEIASVIAHDVRGPASTIMGLATTTRKSYERLGDAERLEFVGMIEQEAARLLSLVNQTALALKVDAGTLTPNLREQELAPLVRQAVTDAAVAGHRVDVDAPAGVVASVDTRWFAEVVRQGVENAARYSPDDAPIRVRLAEDHDGAVVLDIVDGGPGIPVEQREAVFEKFARWRPAGYEDRTGSGLGLFICRGIIHEHGGETGIVDAPDGGTILRIRLPRRGEQER